MDPGWAAAPSSGDDLAEVMAELAVESDKQSRTTEREIAQGEQDAASQAAADEVNALRHKASDLMIQGYVDGFSTIGAGICEGVSAGCPSADKWSKAASTSLQGGAKLGDGLFSAAETNADAREKLDEQNAQRANDSARSARDAASAAQQATEKTLDAYAQIAQTEASTSLSILRRA